MALGKTPTTLVSNQTITAGGTYVSPSSLDLSGAISLEIGFKGTFDASTNAGARVEIFSDITGANSSFTVGTNDRTCSRRYGYLTCLRHKGEGCTVYMLLEIYQGQSYEFR